MWEPNPEYRPTLSEIFNHPWVSKKIVSKQDFKDEIGVQEDEEMKFEELETKSQTMSVDEIEEDESKLVPSEEVDSSNENKNDEQSVEQNEFS